VKGRAVVDRDRLCAHVTDDSAAGANCDEFVARNIADHFPEHFEAVGTYVADHPGPFVDDYAASQRDPAVDASAHDELSRAFDTSAHYDGRAQNSDSFRDHGAGIYVPGRGSVNARGNVAGRLDRGYLPAPSARSHVLIDESHSTLIRRHDDLLVPFLEACKPVSEFRVGTEAEKIGVFADGSPLGYEGERGVSGLLKGLAAHHGWTPEAEYEGGPFIALKREGASVTLEPGCQLELSGAPLRTMHETAREFDVHHAELAPAMERIGARWLGLGFHPFASVGDLEWVPKLRYGVMRSYLPTRGAYALDMMQRTTTVQANFDFASEEDAMRKLRVSLKLSPLVTAMFANSPFVEGKLTGELSHRATVWLDVDNSRAGLLPFAWAESARFHDYIEWALDVPMFLVKRGDKLLHNTGQTFRDFLANGFEGERATNVDWETHLNTLFPEVRLKRTLEVRSADSQNAELLPALPTLWTGILYDEGALAEAEDLVRDLRHDDAAESRKHIPVEALRTVVAGKPLLAYAEKLIDIARGGLERRAFLDEHGRSEAIHLEPLAKLIARGITPAEDVLSRIDSDEPLMPQILEKARL
jgi:glutamate--cysteine ligase